MTPAGSPRAAGRLQDKVALITGTGGGQGRAAAVLFAAEGATVVGADLKHEGAVETLEAVTGSGGRMVSTSPIDLGDGEQARRWVSDAVEQFGRIDILYNNAGAVRFAPTGEQSFEDWQFTLRNELDMIFHVTSAAWPHLCRSGGAVLNTASIAGVTGTPSFPQMAHAAAKGGVVGMTRQLAAEGGAHGVRVNAISPGVIVSPATQHLLDDPAAPLAALMDRIPLSRVGTPEDIARAALFLVSDDAQWITGVNLLVDGGLTAVS